MVGLGSPRGVQASRVESRVTPRRVFAAAAPRRIVRRARAWSRVGRGPDDVFAAAAAPRRSFAVVVGGVEPKLLTFMAAIAACRAATSVVFV